LYVKVSEDYDPEACRWLMQGLSEELARTGHPDVLVLAGSWDLTTVALPEEAVDSIAAQIALRLRDSATGAAAPFGCLGCDETFPSKVAFDDHYEAQDPSHWNIGDLPKPVVQVERGAPPLRGGWGS
jgi:hypothetical protein